MGLTAVVAPLFQVRPLDWEAPDPASFDALLLTSANAVRHAGAQLRSLKALPSYGVGEPTAAEARGAGFPNVRVGESDGRELLALLEQDGRHRVLHLCGRDHVELKHPRMRISHVPVYASDAADQFPRPAREALEGGAVALLHSPRAGRLFSHLVDEAGLDRSAIEVAAISEAAALAAGKGWKQVAVAPTPRDQPLLEVAAKLCNHSLESGTGKRE